MDVTEAIDLICNGDKKDKGCSSQGNVKQIQKLCTWQRECNMRCTDPNGHFSARKNPQELGFDLDLHKGIVERNFFKKNKKPHMPQLEKTGSCSSPDTSNCCVLCGAWSGIFMFMDISSFTWCVLRQRHSQNYSWPPRFFLATFLSSGHKAL